MDLGLAGKVAVVIRGSKGIGLEVLRTLAAEGAQVVAGALTVDGLQRIEGITAIAVDLVEPGGSERLVGEALNRYGRVDVLVNNVGGVRLRLDGFLQVSDDDSERSLQVNFFAALRATRAAVAAMIEQGEVAIVNVASVNSFFHPNGLVVDYGAAKAALLNVAKALSQELGPNGIRMLTGRRRLRKQEISPVGRNQPASIDAPGKNQTCARGLGNAVARCVKQRRNSVLPKTLSRTLCLSVVYAEYVTQGSAWSERAERSYRWPAHRRGQRRSRRAPVGCINSASCCDGLVFMDESAKQIASVDRRRCGCPGSPRGLHVGGL